MRRSGVVMKNVGDYGVYSHKKDWRGSVGRVGRYHEQLVFLFLGGGKQEEYLGT